MDVVILSAGGRIGKHVFVRKLILLVASVLIFSGCDNNPYPPLTGDENFLYSAFTARPKTLDPAKSYSSDEWIFINQIYEAPLQYHYLKRPYTLEPLLAKSMPTITQLQEGDKHYTVYTIDIKPGVYYQKHPAFVKAKDNPKFKTLADFNQTGTREVIADDFVYQINRLFDKRVNSPIAGLMGNYIESAEATSRYQYQIKIKGSYPQFLYWLATPFFAPMPREAIEFYQQPTLIKKNISLDWFPVGTGPFILAENNPNWRMVMAKNPTFRDERYPSTGDVGDEEKGLLAKANKRLPFLDKIVFMLEKESIPYWNKFMQGYYDQAAVNSDNYDQAIKASGIGNVELSEELRAKNIKLSLSVAPSIFYWGFNMLDKTVGGYSESARKLRQAIAIAIDTKEYISIFNNGNGIVAHGPLPPDFLGHQGPGQNAPTLQQAKALMVEAGYPNGIDPKTKQSLIIYYDVPVAGNAQSQSELAWLRKQFKKIGIELVIRATQYNRFQDKMRNGDFQFYSWGWNADYPDPENFLFLFYGKNGKVKFGGENASNYMNPSYDKLFDKMKNMENSPEREKIIMEMIKLLQRDRPWIWGYYPLTYTLRHAWVDPFKVNAMSRNTLKYMSIDPPLRAKSRLAWNQSILWPLAVMALLAVLICVPAIVLYWRKMHVPLRLKTAKKLKDE